MNRFFTLLLAASCLTAVGQVPNYVPTEGLVAWWTFDGDTQDASDNQIHGSSIAASFVPDRFNNDAGAIHMEGNGLVDFGLDQRFGVVSGAGRTVAFWVKSEMQVIPRLQKYENSISGNSNFFVGPAPYPPFSAANGITVTANGESAYTTIDLDWSFWFHVAVVYDGAMGESTLFIDGVPVATEPLTFNNNVSSQPLQLIAARVSNDYPDSNGEVDDLGFWQRVLTHDEILALFEASAPITGCTNPSACNFDGEAVLDDGSCEESGCTDSYACNYTDEASCDDGSCDYTCCPGPGCCLDGQHWDWELNGCVITNPSDSNFDGCVQLNDLLDLLSAYGDCGSEESVWQCGDPLDYQGFEYATVQIGDQCWFAENLRAENYRNGEAILLGNTSSWESFSGGGAAIYPGNNGSNVDSYGMLYNWFTIEDSRGICPSGWVVPSDSAFGILELHLGIAEQEIFTNGWRGIEQGDRLKSSEFWNGSDAHGFGAVPSGGVHAFTGGISGFGIDLWLWTSTENTSNFGRYRHLKSSESRVERFQTWKNHGGSIRCIKDTE